MLLGWETRQGFAVPVQEQEEGWGGEEWRRGHIMSELYRKHLYLYFVNIFQCLTRPYIYRLYYPNLSAEAEWTNASFHLFIITSNIIRWTFETYITTLSSQSPWSLLTLPVTGSNCLRLTTRASTWVTNHCNISHPFFTSKTCYQFDEKYHINPSP